MLVLDGAMGTEMTRRGYDTGLPLWSAALLRTDPHLVTAIHQEYVAAGVDVLTANTFRTNPRAFRAAGLGSDEARSATLKAVDCARSACSSHPTGREPLVAGSLAPVEDCYRPDLAPEADVLLEEHAILADWLRAGGVDVLLCETMNTVKEARTAVKAAAGTGLPVWASLLCAPDGNALYSGEPLAGAVAAVVAEGAQRVGVNCLPRDAVSTALRRLHELTELPLIAYANGGSVHAGWGWDFDASLTPERYAALATEWIELGASVIGGCCGTGPEHIAAVRLVVDNTMVGR